MAVREIVLRHLNGAADWIAPVQNFNSLVGMSMVEWRRDFARIRLDIRPEHANGFGFVHGGVLLTLLDTVSGFAGIHTDETADPIGCVTVAMNSKFIHPAQSGSLHAEARAQGGGKTIFFTYAEIRDDAGNLVATGDGTFRFRKLPPELVEKIKAEAAA
ncbi:MAG TPA: PaaI family thioesterase [Magnetospirillum sp.]|nr:PaaI family thioesterase [Magnetospirillum sp.]